MTTKSLSALAVGLLILVFSGLAAQKPSAPPPAKIKLHRGCAAV